MKTILIFLIPYFPSILHTTSIETVPGSLVCLRGQPTIFLFHLADSSCYVVTRKYNIFLREWSHRNHSA